MNILVCCKTGLEFEQVVDADWENFGLSTELRYVKRAFGCFDETALETALRLRDLLKEQGEDVECCALTLGSFPAPLRKTLYAVGFDHVWAGEEPETRFEFHPRETAAALGRLIAVLGEDPRWDLILLGRQAGYADTGMVPFLLAEQLGLPVITEAERVIPLPGPVRGLVIDRFGEKGRERLEIRLPAAVIMGNSPVSALRAATLAAQIQAAKRPSETPPVPDGMPALPSLEDTPKLFHEREMKTCRFLPGGNALFQSAGEIAAYLCEEQGR